MGKFLFFRGDNPNNVVDNSNELITVTENLNLFFNITKLPEHGTTKRWQFRIHNYIFIFNITQEPVMWDDHVIESALLQSLSSLSYDDLSSITINILSTHIAQNFPASSVINIRQI